MPSLGIGLGLTVSRRGAAAAWSPADLPGLAPSIQVALSRSTGLLWQNLAETVPAVADGDPVRVATCPWTGGKYTAPSDSARPLLWDEGGGSWSLATDAVDDRYAFPAVASAPLSCHAALLFNTVAPVGGGQVLVAGPNGAQKYKAVESELQTGGIEGVQNYAQSTTRLKPAGLWWVVGLNYGATGPAVYWLGGASNGTGTADVSSPGFTANLTTAFATTIGWELFGGRIKGMIRCTASQSNADIEFLHAYLAAL